MADDQDQEQKTEEPSQKRLEEAHEKGNVPVSRELASFLMIALLALTVAWLAPGMLKNAKLLLLPFLADADSLPTDLRGISRTLRDLTLSSLLIILVPLAATVAAAIASGVLQNGFMFTTEPMMPKLERLSPLAGIKRIFSMRSVVEFIKNLLKISIVAGVAFIAVYPEMPHLHRLPGSGTEGVLLFLAELAARMTMGIAIAMFFITLFDIFYQRYQHTKSLRMTKQELKDEYKQSEGDPVIKQRLRALRMERARRRMMADVPKADVVITNPTHYAVALKYDTTTMNAPQLLAKGQDLIALKIREIAEKSGVTVVENPPLARALFSSCEIGQEIPVTHYQAVAKIISYVYQLKGKKPDIRPRASTL